MDTPTVLRRPILNKLITMYKQYRCLWDRNHPDYKKRKIREEAIEDLVALMKTRDPEATKMHVMKKIENLRTCYKREKKKVEESLASRDKVTYIPSLWYYDMFTFLDNEEESEIVPKYSDAKIEDHLDTDQSGDEYEQYEELEEVLEANDTTNNLNDNCYRSPYERVNDSTQHNKKIVPKSQKSRKRTLIQIEDEFDAIGVNVAAKLRSLQTNTAVIAEKLINDVLYQAHINTLTPSSVIVNNDPIL